MVERSVSPTTPGPTSGIDPGPETSTSSRLYYLVFRLFIAVSMIIAIIWRIWTIILAIVDWSTQTSYTLPELTVGAVALLLVLV